MRDNYDTRTRELPGIDAAAMRRAGGGRTPPGGGVASAREHGYESACERGGAGVCGVKAMLFTAAIFVGIAPETYKGRYCYETLEEALRALAAWDGSRDPPGKWIKFKSSDVERLGPGTEWHT